MVSINRVTLVAVRAGNATLEDDEGQQWRVPRSIVPLRAAEGDLLDLIMAVTLPQDHLTQGETRARIARVLQETTA